MLATLVGTLQVRGLQRARRPHPEPAGVLLDDGDHAALKAHRHRVHVHRHAGPQPSPTGLRDLPMR
jgi:hypothetical protein